MRLDDPANVRGVELQMRVLCGELETLGVKPTVLTCRPKLRLNTIVDAVQRPVAETHGLLGAVVVLASQLP